MWLAAWAACTLPGLTPSASTRPLRWDMCCCSATAFVHGFMWGQHAVHPAQLSFLPACDSPLTCHNSRTRTAQTACAKCMGNACLPGGRQALRGSRTFSCAGCKALLHCAVTVCNAV